MCLAVPGKVVRWIERDPLFAEAEIEFAGVKRPCNMACAVDALEGDYVLVHAGVAIARLDADEAERVLADYSRLGKTEDDDLTAAEAPS